MPSMRAAMLLALTTVALAPLLVVATAPEGAEVPDRGQRRVRLESLPRETHIEVMSANYGCHQPTNAVRSSAGRPGTTRSVRPKRASTTSPAGALRRRFDASNGRRPSMRS